MYMVVIVSYCIKMDINLKSLIGAKSSENDFKLSIDHPRSL